MPALSRKCRCGGALCQMNRNDRLCTRSCATCNMILLPRLLFASLLPELLLHQCCLGGVELDGWLDESNVVAV